MSEYLLTKKKRINYLDWIMAFGVVIAVFLTGTPMIKYMNTMTSLFSDANTKIFLMIMCMLSVFVVGRIKKIEKLLSLSVLLVAYLLFYIFITEINFQSFVLNIILVFFVLFVYGFVLVSSGKLEVLIITFVNLVVVLAAISVFFWLFGSVLRILPGGEMISYFWAGKSNIAYSYYGLYFEVPTQAIYVGSGKLIRNCGIFTEAPGYSTYLLLALAIEVFTNFSTKKKYKIVILVLALLSTVSTKSLVLALLIFSVKYLAEQDSSSRTKFLMKVFGSVIVVILAFLGSYFIIETKSNVSSLMIRMDDFLAALKTWNDHKLFGAGYNNNLAIFNNMVVARSNDGLSMGLTLLLAHGGIYLFLFYFASFLCAYKFSFDREQKKAVTLFSIVILGNVIVSNIAYSPLILLVIALGYSTSSVDNYEKKNMNLECVQ